MGRKNFYLKGEKETLYIHGRVTNESEILLPEQWNNKVDVNSISVTLTPVGSHQNLIVKRIGENTVYLQSNGALPIDCYYQIFAEKNNDDE